MNTPPYLRGERVFTRPIGGVGPTLAATVDFCSGGNVFLCFDDTRRSEWRQAANVWRQEETGSVTPQPAPVVFDGAQGHFDMGGG